MKYRLPEALGGGEMEEYRKVSGGTEAPTGTVAFLLDGCLVCVAKALLAEVAPPLPVEPPGGSTVTVAGDAYQRHGTADRADDHWWAAGPFIRRYTWAELCDSAEPPVRLVPDPFAEPVKLPWVDGPVGVKFDPRGLGFPLGTGGPHKVVVDLPGGEAHITASRARAMALALYSAADEAERAS